MGNNPTIGTIITVSPLLRFLTVGNLNLRVRRIINIWITVIMAPIRTLMLLPSIPLNHLKFPNDLGRRLTNISLDSSKRIRLERRMISSSRAKNFSGSGRNKLLNLRRMNFTKENMWLLEMWLEMVLWLPANFWKRKELKIK